MIRITTIIAIFTISVSAASAQNRPTPDQIAATIAPYVEESTVAVLRIDLTRVKLGPLVKRIESLIGELADSDKEKQRVLRQLNAGKTLVQMYLSALVNAGATEVYGVVTLEPLPEPPLLIVVPLGGKVNADALTPLVQMLTLQMPVEQRKIGNALVVGTKSHVTRMKPTKSERLDELKRTFAAAGDAPLQVVVIPPSYIHRAVDELVTDLPKQMGGGESSRLTLGFEWGAMGIHFPPEFKVEAAVKSGSADAAKGFSQLIMQMLQVMQDEGDNKVPDSMIQRLTPRVEKDQVRWTLTDKDLDGFVNDLKPTVGAHRIKAKRAVTMNQMRQLMLAILARAGGHDNVYPTDLGALLDMKVLVQPEVFLSPMSNKTLPEAFKKWKSAERRKWINANSSYIYLPVVHNKVANASNTIVLIEKQADKQQTKVAVAFLDARVEIWAIENVDAPLIKQTGFNYAQWSKVIAGESPSKD